jgi:hypothetical protein
MDDLEIESILTGSDDPVDEDLQRAINESLKGDTTWSDRRRGK